jgi:hypothetical protein
MPREQELPEELKELAWRNAIELSDTRFQYDTDTLIRVIKRNPERSASSGAKTGVARKFWGVLAGLAGLGLIVWPSCYAVTAFPNYVQGDRLGFPIALAGIVLAFVAFRLLRPRERSVRSRGIGLAPSAIIKNPGACRADRS